MKRTLLSLLIVASLSSWGQNTFPSSGNVGIGTSTPSYKLTINDAAGSHLRLENGTEYGFIRLEPDGNLNYFVHGDDDVIFTRGFSNGTESMRINSLGNIGIGTISPASKLQVNGTIMSEARSNTLDPDDNVSNNFQGYGGYWALRTAFNNSFNLDVYNSGSPTTAFYVSQSGQVGIGTTSPAANLQVQGTIMSNARSNTLDPDDNVSNNFQGYAGYWAFRTANNNSFNLDVYNSGAPITAFNVNQNGNVGIGSTSPDSKLTVNGTIHSKEVKVDLSVPGPDYVFEEDYALQSLEEIESYVKRNKHLPDVPSAKEMEEEGIKVGEMNMLLLRKIEEMTLHMIEQSKQLNDMNQLIINQQSEIEKLKSEMK